jgi:hypothetical protein
MSDLFGVSGRGLLAAARLAPEPRARIDSLLRLIEALDFEVDLFAKLVAGRLRTDPGYHAIQQIPGSGRCWPRCSLPRSETSPASASPSS